ncbi:MAG: Na-Ca exchanger/integrin-beta4 [Chthoniobacter sp.]|nr:Na-Ca exchanger/integrin-beta4 [Chthoniobacter sp.]
MDHLPPGRGRLHAIIEALEARIAPATFLVTSVADAGAGTLRQAILDANALAGSDAIRFELAADSPTTIHLTSALPAITDLASINGTLGAPGSSLKVRLDGTSAGPGTNGFVIGPESDGTYISSFNLSGFDGDGIRVTGDSVTLRANTIIGSGGHGIAAVGADSVNIASNSIGSATEGNGLSGIWIEDVARVTLYGNTIFGNGGHGISVAGADSVNIDRNSIGSPTEGNGLSGIWIEDVGQTSIARNQVEGNGTDSNAPLAKRGGVLLHNAPNTTIGTMERVEGGQVGVEIYIDLGNQVLGNRGDGLRITGPASKNIVAWNNTFSNQISGDGIHVEEAEGVRLWGSYAFHYRPAVYFVGNTVVENDGVGVVFKNVRDGSLAKSTVSSNSGGGILINSSSNVSFGEARSYPDQSLGNTIAYNGGDGVAVQLSSGVRIVKSGITSTSDNGISIVGSPGTYISGMQISATGGDGVSIAASPGTYVSATLSNITGNGVSVFDSPNTTVSTNAATVGGDGIQIVRSTASEVTAWFTNVAGDGVSIIGSVGVPVSLGASRGIGGLPVDLNADGVTANDVGDLDGGANRGQNHPQLLSAIGSVSSSNTVEVTGELATDSHNAPFRITIYAFAAASGTYSEVGGANATTDANGFVRFTSVVPVAPGKTHYIASARNVISGDSSEFSSAIGIIPRLTVTGLTDYEGNAATKVFNATLSLSPGATNPVTVTYATADGTAVSGSDYAGNTGSVTFAPGEYSKTIPITIFGDAIGEAPEVFYLDVLQAEGAVLGSGRGEMIIRNEDELPRISVADSVAWESIRHQAPPYAKQVVVTLDRPSFEPVSVWVDFVAGTAAQNIDFYESYPAGQRITFAPGVTEQTVGLSIINDNPSSQEADETVLVRLSSPIDATIADGEGTLTILDDDGWFVTVGNVFVVEGHSGITYASVPVSLIWNGGPLRSGFEVSYATGSFGTAHAGSDYQSVMGTLTLTHAEPVQWISVPINGDTLHEGPESFSLELQNVIGAAKSGWGTVTILDDEPQTLSIADASIQEGPAGSVRSLTFTASLNRPAEGPVRAQWATADSSATGAVDYSVSSGELVFAPGEQTKQFTVAVLGDDAFEGDEAFFVRLSSAEGATIVDAEAIGTILSDDLAFSIEDISIREGQTAVFTVSLSYPIGIPVSVVFSTADGTALAGQDYTSVTQTLTFAAGGTRRFVEVQLSGDDAPEADETFFAMLSSASGASIADGQAVATILNDDSSLLISQDRRNATWRDSDGDLVTLRASRPALDYADFDFAATGPHGAARLEQLHLNLGGTQAPRGTNLTFSVIRDPAFPDGDGLIDIDWINSTASRLGSVTVPGQLGAISVGDGQGTALSRLTVGALGVSNLAGADSDTPLDSMILGGLGTLVVQGGVHNTALIVSGSIGTVTIGGSISSGDRTVDHGISAQGFIGRIRVAGSVLGDAEHPVLFQAAGRNPNGSASAKAAMKSIQVEGDVSFAAVLGGYSESTLVNGLASLGKIIVGGDWESSSILAGASAGEDRLFGTLDDELPAANRASAAKIAQIVISGAISGTHSELDALDHYGIVARTIGSLKVQGVAMNLAANRVDSMSLGSTDDMRLQELRM